MMWLYMAAMLLLALLILLLPLWRRQQQAVSLDSNTSNVAVLKDQLKELESELANGNLSQVQFDQARSDLEASVAADLQDDDETMQPVAAGTRNLLSLLILLVIPLASILFYQQVSTFQEMPVGSRNTNTNARIQQELEQAAGQKLPPIEQMVEVLAAKLREEPDNAEGWRMLGRTYLILEQTDKAVGAYDRAYQLLGDSAPDLLIDYAEVLAFANDNSMQGRPLVLVNQALAVAPDMPKGLWLAGFGAYEADDFQVAIKHWSRALRNPNLGDETRQMLEQYLADARGRMGGGFEVDSGIEPIALGDDESSTETVPISIEVLVSLDESLLSKAQPDETVFVFARAASGMPMPLAVQKLRVADLPISVRLDDSMAMMQGHNLSSKSKVVVGARVSRAGTPMPQPGDLQGVSEALDPKQAGKVDIVIDQVVQ